MTPIIIAIIAVLISGGLLFFLKKQKQQHPLLKFNGLYVAEGGDRTFYYLRFYSDGVVISVSSTGAPDKVKTWFNREGLDEGKRTHGSYTIKGDTISFTTRSTSGEVDYSGGIKEGSLHLNYHSRINGNRNSKIFKLIAD